MEIFVFPRMLLVFSLEQLPMLVKKTPWYWHPIAQKYRYGVGMNPFNIPFRISTRTVKPVEPIPLLMI